MCLSVVAAEWDHNKFVKLSLHIDAWRGVWICVRSQDAPKQLDLTRAFTIHKKPNKV